MPVERQLVDGFTYSSSLLYLPTTYRVSALAQMEVLRKAKGYRARQYVVPETLEEPVVAFSQLEFQVRTQPGAYVWGISFSAPFDETDDGNPAKSMYLQVTDACTETPFFSDYMRANQFQPVTGPGLRNPFLLPQPHLVGEPALLNVEIYNSAAVNITCQVILFCAEPCVPPESIVAVLRELGVAEVLS